LTIAETTTRDPDMWFECRIGRSTLREWEKGEKDEQREGEEGMRMEEERRRD
jgi:hypothetical protein